MKRILITLAVLLALLGSCDTQSPDIAYVDGFTARLVGAGSGFPAYTLDFWDTSEDGDTIHSAAFGIEC
ncbi:MAG TPA: hypothetical protein ENH94_06260, partial [Phycisphaerales bacterium]|nr:hypothetical protein [Phycisphaerales bacterium]